MAIQKIKTAITVTLPAYTANDCVGGTITVTVGEGSLTGTQGAIIRKIMLTDAAAQSEKYNVHFYNAEPAAAARTDADEHAPVAADIAKLLHTEYIADTDYIASGTYHSTAIVNPDAYIEFDGKDLFVVLECTETPDYAATDDLELTLYLEKV